MVTNFRIDRKKTSWELLMLLLLFAYYKQKKWWLLFCRSSLLLLVFKVMASPPPDRKYLFTYSYRARYNDKVSWVDWILSFKFFSITVKKSLHAQLKSGYGTSTTLSPYGSLISLKSYVSWKMFIRNRSNSFLVKTGQN